MSPQDTRFIGSSKKRDALTFHPTYELLQLLNVKIHSSSVGEKRKFHEINTQSLRKALGIAREARQASGVNEDNIMLSAEQVHKAFSWLHREVFEEHYVNNAKLRDDIERHQTHLENSSSRREKQQLHQNSRGAFKVWMFSLLGNKQLFKYILIHGVFDANKLTCYLIQNDRASSSRSKQQIS